MEHRSRNTGTEIMENYVHRDKEDDAEKSFLSHEELEEYKKITEVFLTFSKAKTTNKSDLRKSLLNIAANLMRVLVVLENATNQESTGFAAKPKPNQQYKSYDNDKSLKPEDERIPKQKLNRNLEQKNNKKDAQIPKVTIKKLCNNNKPGYVGYADKSLHENNECRINAKKSDSRSSKYIPLLRENATQTLLQKDEICNNQLKNETEIVFECKNVEPTITSFAPQQFECLSQNQLQYSEINEATRAAIKDERLDMVKKEYLDATIEKVNLNNDCEINGQNEIIPHLNSTRDSNESEKIETCSKKLEKNSSLKVHKDTVHDHITHSWEISGKKFLQRNKLKIHTEVVHNSQKPYQCNTCGKTFARKDKLVHHMDSIHIACDASRKTFAQKNHLINPIDLVHNGEKSHDRGTHGKALRQNFGLKKDIYKARKSITHTCDTCGKTFTRKDHLKDHIDFVHKNLKHHKCDECQKSFIHKTGLNFHMSSVHNGITHTCDICEKKFTRKGTLRVHIDIVHMGKGNLFKCDECPKSFNYKCDRTSHIDLVHKGITHPCDFCKKVFSIKSNLKVHKDSVHKGIAYPCDLCEKVFSLKSNLKVHKDSVHKGITHSCDQCEKSYSSKTYLKLHIDRIHNGKKSNKQ